MKTSNRKAGPIFGELLPRMRKRQPVGRECDSLERVILRWQEKQTRALASVAACVLAFSCAGLLTPVMQAQTTLSGDHVVDGNLSVGFSGTSKDLNLSGNAFVSGSLFLGGWDLMAAGAMTVELTGGFVMPPGWFTTAIGGGLVYGDYSTAISGGYADGGYYNVALSGGTAIGNLYVTALSEGYAEGNSSTAMSGGSAIGNYSMSSGSGCSAESLNSVAIGRGALAAGDFDTWVETDPLFVVGNGTGDSEDDPEVRYRNAFVVYKSGKINLNGDTKVKGKISLFTETGTAPSIVFDPEIGTLEVNGQSLLAPNSEGNVGIGVSEPEYLLDVGGDAQIVGDVIVGAPEAEKTLTINGSTTISQDLVVNGWNFNAKNAMTVELSGGTVYPPGWFTTAMSGGVVNGDYATAISGGEAYGHYSVALSGGHTLGFASSGMSGGAANGNYSMASGSGCVAEALNSVALGRGALAGGNPDAWIETDPVFVVGNGTGDAEDDPEIRYRNALVILKNGNIQITKRQGDILMGEFGEEE